MFSVLQCPHVSLASGFGTFSGFLLWNMEANILIRLGSFVIMILSISDG